MKIRTLVPILLVVVLIPQVAFAAWWNPFSWKIFTRIFTPKTEVIQIATTTDSNAEIEKLRVEVEELKKQQTDNSTSEEEKTKRTTKVTQPTKPIIPVTTQPNEPITPVNTQPLVNYDALYKDINDKYFSLRNKVDEQIIILDKSSDYNQTKTTFRNFLREFSKTLNADMRELTNIWNVTPKPANIVNLYVEKYSKLLNDYNTQRGTYDRYLADLKELEAARVKTTAEATLIEKQQYVHDIEVKRAEMSQLNVQIDTLAGSSLMGILNTARKLDDELLFYTFKYKCSYGNDCTFTYPYESKYYDNNSYISNVRDGLRAIVSNYNAFLYVELMKNK